jgi:integrase
MASIKQRKGKKGFAYEARVRVRGQPAQCRSFKTKAEAREWSVRTEAALTGRMYAVSRDATLRDLLAEYSPKAKPSTQPLLRYWAEKLGSSRLRDITPPMVTQHRDALLGAPTRSHGQKKTKPRSGATVNQYLSALSVAFKYAISERGLCDSNPVLPVKKCPPSQWRVRFLSDEERSRLIDASRSHAHLYAAVVLSLTTGIRRGSLMGMRWRDIQREARWLVIPKAKNGDAHGVPLTEAALTALSALPRSDDLVFSFDLTKAWRSALKSAQITDFKWHDMRHSAASRLIAKGANTIQIAHILGHKTLTMTKRYAHVQNSHTVSLVEQANGDIR